MRKFTISAASLLLLLAVSAFTTLQGWSIREDFSIKFSGKDVSGIFRKFSGTLVFDEKNLPASSFNVKVDVNSINTGNGLQNKHAKSADWLDAEKYPAISFVSSRIEKSGGSFQVTGMLELHGVKKEITFPFTFSRSGNEATFNGIFTVNRADFRIAPAEDKVAPQIKLEITVPVTKK